jgi:hypothetical protein
VGPYIGITGFMTACEVSNILGSVPEKSDRLVMIGVLVSLKTMQGIKNKFPNRYPEMEDIAEIFQDHTSALNLIHYSTDEKENLLEQMIKLTEIGGSNLNGFQLNVVWPKVEIIRDYRRIYPEKQIVLQVGNHALEQINHSPQKASIKIAEYEGLIEYVLLDTSGGYGKQFNTEIMSNYMRFLKENNPTVGLGVAGGLSYETLHILEPIVKEFPDLNIDAEGRLRDGEDRLNINLAKEYLKKAFNIFMK